MEQKDTCTTVVTTVEMIVFRYTLANGSAETICAYASVKNCFGKIVGGICIASPTLLNDVSTIQMNGNTIIPTPARRIRCTKKCLTFALFFIFFLLPSRN